MYILKKHKESFRKIIYIVIFILIILSYFVFESVKDIVNILLISYILASILNPIKEKLIKIKYINIRVASIILILLLISIMVLVIYAIIPGIFKEINNITDIIERLKKYFYDFEKSDFCSKNYIVKYLYSEGKIKIVSLFQSSTENTINILIKISDKIISYFVVPVVTYYFLVDKDKISKKIYKLIPIQKRSILRKIINDCNKLLGSYLIGQIILSILISIITFIGLVIFKIRFPLGLSLINGILNIIPYFGAIFGAVPIVLLAFMESTRKGISIVVFLFIIQQIEGNILSPKITGDTTNIHPLMIIILLLVGEKLGGFIGMIIVIPISVIVKVVYEDINSYIF